MTIAVGQTARRSATLTAEHVRLYSELSGDRNPLHFEAGPPIYLAIVLATRTANIPNFRNMPPSLAVPMQVPNMSD